MKRVMFGIIFGILIVSLVFGVYAEVQNNYQQRANNNYQQNINTNNRGIGEELSREIKGMNEIKEGIKDIRNGMNEIKRGRNELMEGNYSSYFRNYTCGPGSSRCNFGDYTHTLVKTFQFRRINNESKELRFGNSSARTKLNITVEVQDNQTILRVILKNGTEKEIRVMPDTALERALNRLKLKFCNNTNNCTVELKEIIIGKKIKIGYEVQVERHSRVMGFSRLKFLERMQIDAETGEFISFKRYWMSNSGKKSD